MQAKTTKAFRGRRDNEGFMTEFAPGDLLEGDLARSAVKQRIAAPYDADVEARRAAAEAAAEQAARDKEADEKIAADKASAEKAARDKAAADKAAAEKAAADKAGK